MADINLIVTIPDQYKQVVMDAFTLISGKQLEISVSTSNYYGHWSFNIIPKDNNETLKEFGERFLRELVKAVIRLVDLKNDEDRYRNEVETLIPPSQNIPDDVLG